MRWRLLLDGPGAGAWNMAVDAALLRSAERGAPPALRFYAWNGPWLSLGLSQRLAADRAAACRKAGVGIARRVTGGRAVLHGSDLTYAVAAPAACLPAGLPASYALLAEALQAGLAGLGILASRSLEPASGRPPGAFDCFASLALQELCVAGRKLAGNAQRRSAGGVMQHGSLRLAPDPADARAAAGLAPGAATSLAELGFRLDPEAVRSALIEGFAKVLGVDFEASTLSAEEHAFALERVAWHASVPA